MGRLVWASTMTLRIGRWLVGVRPDSDRTAQRLESFLESYVVAQPEVSPRSNFSVRAPRGRGWLSRAGNLYIAGETAARSPDFGTLLLELARHLAGVAAASEDSAQPRARLLAREGRAVVVDAPMSVDLAAAGRDVTEIRSWRPIIDTRRGAVVLPPPLPDLNWAIVGHPPRDQPVTELDLVGVVLPPNRVEQPDIERLWLQTTGDLDGWGLMLDALDHQGRVRSADSADDLRLAVRELLI